MPVSISTEGAIASIPGGVASALPTTGDTAFGLAFDQTAGLATESTKPGGLVPLLAPDVMPQTQPQKAAIAKTAPPAVLLDLGPDGPPPSAPPEAAPSIVQRHGYVVPEPVKNGSNMAETPDSGENESDAIPPLFPVALPVAAQPILGADKQPTAEADVAPQNMGPSALPGVAGGIDLSAPLLRGNRHESGEGALKTGSIPPNNSNMPDIDAPANAVSPHPVTPNGQTGPLLQMSPNKALATTPPLAAASAAITPAETAVSQPPVAAQTAMDARTVPPAQQGLANQDKAFAPTVRDVAQSAPTPPAPATKTDASGQAPAMPLPATAPAPKSDMPTQSRPANPAQDPLSAKPHPLPESEAVASPDAQSAKEASPRPVQADAPPLRPFAEVQDPAPDENPNPAAAVSGVDAPLSSSTSPPRLAPLHSAPQRAMQHIAQALHHAPDGRLELVLTPHELGHLKMTLTPADSGISVTIHAERPETTDLMRRHIDMLGQEFRELGYSDVRFDFGQGGQRQQSPQNTPAHTVEEPQPAQTPQHSADPAAPRRDGLDIRI